MFSRWSLENTNSFCFQIPRWTYAHVALLWFVPSIKRLKFESKPVFVEFPAWPPAFTNNFHAHTHTPPCKRKKMICSQWLFPPSSHTYRYCVYAHTLSSSFTGSAATPGWAHCTNRDLETTTSDSPTSPRLILPCTSVTLELGPSRSHVSSCLS